MFCHIYITQNIMRKGEKVKENLILRPGVGIVSGNKSNFIRNSFLVEIIN